MLVAMTTTTIGLPASDEIVYASAVPFDARRIGAAAIYCSDGRFGEQMDEFLHRGLGLPRYDRLAVPGGAACLAGHVSSFNERSALERQLEFLIRAHELERLVLIAHHDCAYYRNVWLGLKSLEQQQADDLRTATSDIRRVHREIEIDAFFARKLDGHVVFERWELGLR
jgi:hypothetical protein